MLAGLDGDLELGADPIGRGHQQGIVEACGLEIKKRAESAETRGGAGACGGAGQRLDRFDQCGAGIDIDSGVTVVLSLYDILERYSSGGAVSTAVDLT
jgi:hypothetical protein